MISQRFNGHQKWPLSISPVPEEKQQKVLLCSKTEPHHKIVLSKKKNPCGFELSTGSEYVQPKAIACLSDN